MANTPKRVTDPTEAALSAIQDALSVRDASAESEPDNAVAAASPPASHINDESPPWRGARTSAVAADDMLHDEEIRSPEEQIPVRRPANDDRESIGQILRSL